MSQSSGFYNSSTLKSNKSLNSSLRVPVLVATRRITLRLIHHSCHPSWLKVHLKLFMLISFPSLYLFTSANRWPLVFYFVCVVVFSSFLVFSCNLALPRLSSFRVLFARTLCVIGYSKANSVCKGNRPVVWSIGSKPKTEKAKLDSGSFVRVYSNGDVYEGEFHKGKCSGSGVYYYHMSGRYEGDWVDEKYDGYGIETWAKGSRYRGQYRKGLRHGVGVYRSYAGDVYAGEWCSGQCHGCGSHTCADGSSYVGEFKWGVKHGLGHYHFRNGDRYAGEYFADNMHGFGVYTFGNGHRYEGAWHEGRRQGLGMYTFRNGDSQSGHWQNGALNVPSTDGKLSRSPSMVDHSKVLAAVQEARRVAEKAAGVSPIDERVDRAISAANKAATSARVAAVKAVQNRLHQNKNNDFSVPTPLV
ncbi:kinase [Lithospermum erythrorhizon]|uniref:Kinase n=1 Tax=Lithospermum erythrorhizon TaxID=34254 RepID=A0AAV3QQ46_LITER